MKLQMFLRPCILLAFILVACEPATAPVVPAVPSPLTETPIPATATPSPNATPVERQATITSMENDVQAHASADEPYAPAAIGQHLRTGGQAKSGETGKARFDLLPEGTILRIGPNSLFTLEELSDDPQNLFSRFRLFMGKIWVILLGGTLEVDTQVGIAAVRGSHMGISYDAAQMTMLVTCLEGFCSLKNDYGLVEMTGGQASLIPGEGKPPLEPRPMTDEEIIEWLENNPEIFEFIEEIPIVKEWLEVNPTPLEWFFETPTGEWLGTTTLEGWGEVTPKIEWTPPPLPWP